jgi:hypothetical protein
MFHIRLVCSISICYILWSFGIFFPLWCVVQRKNLANLTIDRYINVFQRLVSKVFFAGKVFSVDKWLFLFSCQKVDTEYFINFFEVAFLLARAAGHANFVRITFVLFLWF